MQKHNYAIEACKSENIQNIITGLNRYNLSKVQRMAEDWTRLEFFIKDDNGQEIGGILGGIGYWNGLEIKALWVHEHHRNQGLGTQLLTHIETLAKEKGATNAMLDTFDFQAEQFYLKNKYEVIGEISDFPKGHRRIYFSKKL